MTESIAKESTVVMHFHMKLDNGEIAKSTYEDKPVKFTMGDGSFSEEFERQITGLKVGERKTIKLSPDDSFGEPNPQNVYNMPRKKFPEDIQLEKDLAVSFDHLGGREMVGIVKDFDAAFVVVDFNHPLSGQNITFDIEVVELMPGDAQAMSSRA